VPITVAAKKKKKKKKKKANLITTSDTKQPPTPLMITSNNKHSIIIKNLEIIMTFLHHHHHHHSSSYHLPILLLGADANNKSRISRIYTPRLWKSSLLFPLFYHVARRRLRVPERRVLSLSLCGSYIYHILS